MTQRQNIFGFILLSAIFVGWLVYSESKSNDSEKYAATNDLKDSDGDGVLDEKDQCPNEVGEVNLFGCPDGDMDGDGVNDKNDACPKEKGTKSNNGCVKEETAPIPEPVDNFDENKKVEITYNGNIYIIKQGLASENGMVYNNTKWRYYNGKWQKQEVDDASGTWKNVTKADIDFILKKHANKKPKTESGGNGGNSGTGGSAGSGSSTSGGSSSGGGSNSGEKVSIPQTNKNLLKAKHDEIIKDGEVSAAEQRVWSTMYKEKYTNGKYKKDSEIESWNDDIMQ
jgi:uncharacterized membrane protein YgcG